MHTTTPSASIGKYSLEMMSRQVLPKPPAARMYVVVGDAIPMNHAGWRYQGRASPTRVGDRPHPRSVHFHEGTGSRRRGRGELLYHRGSEKPFQRFVCPLEHGPRGLLVVDKHKKKSTEKKKIARKEKINTGLKG